LVCWWRRVASPTVSAAPIASYLRQLSEHVALAAHQAQLYGELQRAYDDLRQSQQAIMQQERLRALGEMASGIRARYQQTRSPRRRCTPSRCWSASRV